MKTKTILSLILAAALGIMSAPVFLGWPPAKAGVSDRKAQQESTAETAGADILTNNIQIDKDGLLRVHVGLATSGVFSIVIKTKLGAVLDVINFNAGTALTADAGYIFDWAARVDRSYNYRTGASGDVTMYVDALEDQS